MCRGAARNLGNKSTCTLNFNNPWQAAGLLSYPASSPLNDSGGSLPDVAPEHV